MPTINIKEFKRFDSAKILSACYDRVVRDELDESHFPILLEEIRCRFKELMDNNLPSEVIDLFMMINPLEKQMVDMSSKNLFTLLMLNGYYVNPILIGSADRVVVDNYVFYIDMDGNGTVIEQSQYLDDLD